MFGGQHRVDELRGAESAGWTGKRQLKKALALPRPRAVGCGAFVPHTSLWEERSDMHLSSFALKNLNTAGCAPPSRLKNELAALGLDCGRASPAKMIAVLLTSLRSYTTSVRMSVAHKYERFYNIDPGCFKYLLRIASAKRYVKAPTGPVGL